MDIGILGPPQSGKSTLLGLLQPSRQGERKRATKHGVGVMEVPDPRVDWLSDLYHPRRAIYPRMELAEIGPHKGQELLLVARGRDALIMVIPSFMAPSAREILSFVDTVESDFFIADLASVESRLERIRGHKSKAESGVEIAFLLRCQEALGETIPLRKVDFPPHEWPLVVNSAFFTSIPIILAVNVSEENLGASEYPGSAELAAKAEAMDYPLIVFSGAVEEEIAALPESERMGFLEEYGLRETGVSRIARATYACLGLISFLTVGDDEVRAWTIKKGTKAKEAAGKVHTDLERGFIRAEVVAFQDIRTHGSMKACREKGLVRLEGKDYVVQDGDIMDIRFNV